MSISSSASLITATHLRCSALKIIPEIDVGFMGVLVKGVEKGCDQRGELAGEYFIKAAPAVIDVCLYRKSDVLDGGDRFNCSAMVEKLLVASKVVGVGSADGHIKRSKQGLLTIKHLIDGPVKANEVGHPSVMGQLITNPTNDSLEKLACSVQKIGIKGDLTATQSKKILASTKKLLASNDIHELSILVEASFSSSTYSNTASQVLGLFSSWLKKQLADATDIPFSSIRELYSHLSSYFQTSNRDVELKYISDSLLNLSSKCKTSKYYTDLLHDSLSVELSILGKTPTAPNSKFLIPKLERVVVGYLSSENYPQAMDIIVKTISILFNSRSITTPIAEIGNCESVHQCIVFLTRICIKKLSAVELLHPSSEHKFILELVLWNLIGNTKSVDLANRIMGVLYPISDLTCQLRSSVAYFLITGSLYAELEPHLPSIINQLVASTPETLYIKSMTEFTLAISNNNQQKVSYICDAVVGMSDFILTTDSPTLYRHEIDSLASFLELNMFHNLRIHLLSAFVSSLEKATTPESRALQGTYRLQIARCYHYLGYSGAVRHQLSFVNKMLTSSSPLEYAFFLTMEAEYFTSLDRKDDAIKSLAKLQSHIESTPILREPLSAGRNSGESAQHFQERIVLYCRATQAYVSLWVLNGIKEYAIVAMMNITRLLPNLIKRPGYNVWILSSLLMDAHFRISKIYEQVSIVKEAQYHIEEAIKLAESTDCFLGLSQFLTFEAELFVRMGKSDGAQTLLHRCEEIFDDEKQFLPSAKKGIEFLNIIYSTAFYLQRQNLFNEEQVYYDMGESVYSQVEFPAEAVDLSRRLSELTLSDKKTAAGLQSIRNKLIRSHIYSLGEQGLVDDASKILIANKPSPSSPSKPAAVPNKEDILFKLSESRNCYLKAKTLLMLDPVYGVLQDSAISVPSINNDDSGRKTSLTNLPTNVQCAEAVKYLIQAKSGITENIARIYQICSNTEKVDTSNLLNSITILLSAVCNAQERSLYNYFSYLERSKASSTLSERKISVLRQENGNNLEWPKHITNYDDSHDFDTMSLLRSLPDNWLVVSLNIASATGNLVVSRYEKERDPFMITLPLNRHTSRDVDEASFSFNDGLLKLQEIINLSNASADISRTSGINTTEEKRMWWDERFQLDRQLETLLHDAEYCWLGGFRGIFDCQVPAKKLADKFANDFKAILDRYLPSRGMMRSRPIKGGYKGGKKPIQKVTINPRVFELFLGLGEPDSLEDPGLLEDLVYFVLDIIQFHGEQNAYDELDIDQLVVDVEECLRSYHARALNVDSKQYDHIILVVDKKCQQFPWESIPLLRKRSVTRVPSLVILNKLLSVRNSPSFSPPGQDVYYVLNPSKDLVRTQARFEEDFQQMSDWEGLVCKAPSEDEFANALTNKDLFIYIGHGGGERYIRSGRIKTLGRCCPTLLFGCSSGVVQEAGEYDPFGTAMNFMAAGCPMLLANMWDVTDKDIDLFTKNMLQRWGVTGTGRENIGQAVMSSRGDCTLKYLTGAAPVVYGLPLESAVVL